MKTRPRRDRLKPRKKPVQSRSASTVDAIVEAAARILEERGLDGYTTNAIAERAGVSIGSLYQYFPGKDALTAALLERETAVLWADFIAARAERDWRVRLRLMIRAAVQHQMRRPTLARLLDFEESRLVDRSRDSRVKSANDAIAEVLRMAGARSSDDVSVQASDLIAIVRGLTDAAGERGETDALALERRVSRAVFGYLGRAEGRSRAG
jgi:AcrR family transcriptional regulator